MIAKASDGKARRRRQEPLEVRLTFRINYGDTPAEAVTVMNDRRVPMVNSVFDNRDRIVRFLATSILRVGMAQPKVVREIFPALKLIRRLTGGGEGKR